MYHSTDIEPTPQPERCRDCNGEGSFEQAAPQRDDPYFCVVVECKNCNGCGWV